MEQTPTPELKQSILLQHAVEKFETNHYQLGDYYSSIFSVDFIKLDVLALTHIVNIADTRNIIKMDKLSIIKGVTPSILDWLTHLMEYGGDAFEVVLIDSSEENYTLPSDSGCVKKIKHDHCLICGFPIETHRVKIYRVYSVDDGYHGDYYGEQDFEFFNTVLSRLVTLSPIFSGWSPHRVDCRNSDFYYSLIAYVYTLQRKYKQIYEHGEINEDRLASRLFGDFYPNGELKKC